MPEYYNVTTNLGDAEIANAIATNTKLNITHIAFGDGNGSVPTPNKARTSLVREVHRQAVTKYERHATNANWIVIETIIPSDIGGFTIREMGIIANGKLISHGSHAPFEKVADPSGVSEYRLRFTQNVTDGSVVELTLDESLIYATQAWIDENYIPRTDIVDDLTTDDSTKVASAKTVKELQDGKLEASDLTDASTIQKGIVQIATDQEVQASLDTSKVITPSHLGLIWTSVGKNGVDVSASRAINTIYKNTGPRSKFIAIGKSNQQAAMQLNVNDIQWGYATGSNEDSQFKTLYAIVPPQAEYGTVGSSSFRFWSEIEL